MYRACLQLLSILFLTTTVLSDYIETRIVGGQDEDIENAPWQIALFFDNHFICGGSIYSESFIITAAHCIENKPVSQLQIRAGSTKFDKGGVLISVAETLWHPDYDRETISYDIAVLRLEQPVTFNPSIKAIPVAQESPKPWSWATITGWGRHNDQWTTAPTLQVAKLQILSKMWCMLELFPFQFVDTFCAFNMISSVCQGDSGGPLVIDGKLVGIVSFGMPNCVGASGFVDVSKMRYWITNAVERFK